MYISPITIFIVSTIHMGLLLLYTNMIPMAMTYQAFLAFKALRSGARREPPPGLTEVYAEFMMNSWERVVI